MDVVKSISQRLIGRLAALLLLVALAATSCTASVETEAPTGADDAAPTVETGAPTVADDVATADSPSSERRGFSIAGSLVEIPLSATQGEAQFQVSMADVEAAADIARVRRPADHRNTDQVVDFIGPLTGFSDRRLRVFVPFPSAFVRAAQFQDEAIDEFGFGLTEVETFVALDTPPHQFFVFSGIESRADLPEVAPGVMTVGQGEDFEPDFEDRSRVRELGRPFRISERDGRVAIGLDTAAVAAWHDPAAEPTLANNEQLLVIAQRLDELDVVSAMLNTFDSDLSYAATGIGWTEDDNGPLGVIVLSYDSAAQAQDSLDIVTASFWAPLASMGVNAGELIVLEEIELRDTEIVAIVRFANESRPQIILEMLFRQDGPFTA